MTILALEFSSPQRSVAVTRDGHVVAEIIESSGRNANGFGMIDQVLAETHIRREQIEGVCIGLGPGSYTGIRSAIAMAQGWRLARGINVTGVSSAEAIAVQAQSEQIWGHVNVVIDAQRNEFYLSKWEISAGERKEIEPLKIVSLAAVRSHDRNELLVGPQITNWFPDGKSIFPRAVALLNLAMHRNDFPVSENLEPIYLRETNFVKALPRKANP
jgi:tRNA threonylcarbamoyladenosine biosynthesis protein TsaB